MENNETNVYSAGQKNDIALFTHRVNDLLECKYILAAKRISSLLKCVVSLPVLMEKVEDVALVFFLLNGLDSIKTSSVDADDAAPSSSEGMLERAADGTPFVHHRDGSTTQLKDNGDGTFNDGSGNNWSGNGSGSLFR